jgi:molybdopterin-biosynthesis enzyme MoeA-like protein
MIFIPKIKRDTNLFKRKSGNFSFRVIDNGRVKFITLHTKVEKEARDMRTAMIRDLIASGNAVFDSDIFAQTGAIVERKLVLQLPGIPPEIYKTLPEVKKRLRSIVAKKSTSKR